MRLALAVGLEATTNAAADPAALPALFTSSGGDGANCHEICQVLAGTERALSPTRFHNSVHNAPSGYWGIATGASAASNALCAFDASFGAGLLEALTQVQVDRTAVLLIAYDASYPAPLLSARPIPDAFGVALVLAPAAGRDHPRASHRRAVQRARRAPGAAGTRGAARHDSGRAQPAAARSSGAARDTRGGHRLSCDPANLALRIEPCP